MLKPVLNLKIIEVFSCALISIVVTDLIVTSLNLKDP